MGWGWLHRQWPMVNRLCLCNEASIENQREGDQRASRWANMWGSWEGGALGESGGLWTLSIHFSICISSIWLFLSYALISSVQSSHSVMSDSLQPHGLHHARLPCPSPSPKACSNSCPSSRWCHPTISSSVVRFFSHLESFPASGSFLVTQFFVSGGQRIGTSASASVLPMNIQDWFPLGLPGLLSLQSKGLSRVFSNTIAEKHQFFSAQSSLWSNSHIHTWLLEKS